MNRNQIVESLVKKILNEKNTNIGGSFQTDLENGPKNHGSRPLGNWQSDNAWDVFAPAGTVVNSYTNGTVTKVRDTGKNSGKIFGTQVSIQGGEGYPDIFYTHLKNVKLNKGDIIKVGDRIGVISEWVGHDKMTHVHIGLPKGKHLRDLLKNSSLIFTGKGEEEKPDDVSTDDVSTDDDAEEKPSEASQIEKLGLSGFAKLARMMRGEKEPTSVGTILDPTDEEDKVDKKNDKNSSNVTVDLKDYKITEPSSEDKGFYTKVLSNIGAPISKENLLFFYAWRQAEGAKSTYNPFNTTQPTEGSTLWNCLSKKSGKCVGGVRNYKTKQDGIDATVKTINNGNYKCIVDGLKGNKGAAKIAECPDLKKWGTGGGVTRVLKTKKINPPAISTSEVKTVNESFNYETKRISDLIKKVL
jgi:hypothetical protein